MKKNKTLFAILIFLISSVSYGQVETKVTETKETIGDVSGPALHVLVHRASKKEIIKKIKSSLKERTKEVKAKGDEIYATNVIFPSISEHEIKVYAKVKEFSAVEHEVYLIFLNGDRIISTKTDMKDFKTAEDYLHNFANDLSRESNDYFIDVSEKELKSLERELERLRSQKDKDESEIVSLGKKIKGNEKDISKLDGLENLDEKAIKSRAKMEKEILEYKEKIEQLKKDIEENKLQQEELVEKVKKQREVISDAKKDKELFD